MSDITREDVAHLARLARLAVTDDELDVFSGQLDAILDTVARVSEIDDDVPPTSHAVPLTNVLRPDEPAPSLERAAALAGAPAAEEGRFRVPRILGEEP
jgi:aspartyl-tRNA(Asn)/glutamyl-tRNA(Gln) amidotransferase subunit C